MRITAEEARTMAEELQGLNLVYDDIKVRAENGFYHLMYNFWNDDTDAQRKYLLNSEKAIRKLKNDGYKVTVGDRQMFPSVVISW